MASEREIHAAHPARPGETLCGMHAGPGCRMTKGAPPVTCTACRAVVSYCRDNVRIGPLHPIHNPQGDDHGRRSR